MGRPGVPALDPDPRAAAPGDGMVHQGCRAVQGHGDQRAVGRHLPTHDYESEGPGEGLRGDHRHQGEPPVPRRGRGRSGGSDADADEPQPLRRLHQRLRPDRHALASAKRGEPDRLDGGRGQGRHRSDARRRRLHGQVVHHRTGRQALAAHRPAVRQPLLVPQGLVRPSRDSRRSSRPSTATSSACRSTGRPTRTSPTSSPTT